MSLFDAKFYDFYSYPAPDSISKLAFEAKRYGYSGIAVLDREINPDEVEKPDGFSIYSAVEISCKPSKIRDEIKKHDRKRDIMIAKGGDEEFSRAAAETEGIDILLQPVRFNNVLAQAAQDNSVAIGFNAGSIIHTRDEARVRELAIMRSNLKHARKYGLRMILTGDYYSIYDLRSPREIAAIGALFGMTAKEAVGAMSGGCLEILGRKSPDYIQEGIGLI